MSVMGSRTPWGNWGADPTNYRHRTHPIRPTTYTEHAQSVLLLKSKAKSHQEIRFWRKATSYRKIYKISRRQDLFEHWFTYSCQVSRKLVKRKWPNGRTVFIKTKRLVFCRSLELLERSCQKFYRITLSPFPSVCQVLSKSVQFCGDISENVCRTHYNNDMKPGSYRYSN